MISIIIPVYNAQKYIGHCIESILEQSYGQFEIIIVDDGSEDSSLQICSEFSKHDKRIRIIHTENSGVSHARNIGLDNANGEYVCFIDSDDYIEKDYLEQLLKLTELHMADLVVCNFKVTGLNADNRNYNMIESDYMIQNIPDIVKDCAEHKIYTYTVWGKLFRKDAIDNNRFSDLKFSEDAQFVRTVLLNCKKVCLTEYRGYIYSLNINSVTNDTKRNLEKLIDATYMLIDFCKKYKNYIAEKDNKIFYKDILTNTSAMVKMLWKEGKELNKESFERLKILKEYVCNSGENTRNTGLDKKAFLKLILAKVYMQIYVKR